MRPLGKGDKSCANFGVDLNRNWPAFWNLGNGSSSDPCHDQYSGPSPLSEPETRAVAKAVAANIGIRAHVDVHSFGQFIYRDWAYKAIDPENRSTVENKQWLLARALRMAIRGENQTDMIDIGAHFATARITNRTQGGTLMDYMMQNGIPSVTVELGPRLTRENAASGFAMNETDLLWRSREMFLGFEVMLLTADPQKELPEYSDSEVGVVFP